ncbi:MAG: hypothetical protein MRJ92_01370 [Nitrospira sp.]|nr:hypothetical protein [Nitrospira sp.]
MAAYLSPPPANLTAKATQSKTDVQLRRVILEERPGTAMTGYEGAFEEAQLADLIAYIHRSNHEVREGRDSGHRYPLMA